MIFGGEAETETVLTMLAMIEQCCGLDGNIDRQREAFDALMPTTAAEVADLLLANMALARALLNVSAKRSGVPVETLIGELRDLQLQIERER